MSLYGTCYGCGAALPPPSAASHQCIGIITRITANGLGFVRPILDYTAAAAMAFTFDKIDGYRGESLSELGWRAGSRVLYTTDSGGKVARVRAEVKTEEMNGNHN